MASGANHSMSLPTSTANMPYPNADDNIKLELCCGVSTSPYYCGSAMASAYSTDVDSPNTIADMYRPNICAIWMTSNDTNAPTNPILNSISILIVGLPGA